MRQINRPTDRPTDRLTDQPRDRLTDSYTDRQKYILFIFIYAITNDVKNKKYSSKIMSTV